MNDPIDRQAAIDALRYAQHRFTVADEAGGMGTVKWSEDVIYFAAAERVLTELPPAQPEHDENDLDFVQTHKRIPVQLVVSSDCISRQAAIDEIKALYEWHDTVTEDRTIDHLKRLPSAQPEPCEDAVSRNAIIQKLNTMDRYVSEELILCDTDKKFPKNEVFIVDDVYEEIVENLPSAQPDLSGYSSRLWKAAYERGKAEAQPDIIHCGECKYYDDSDGCFFSTATTGADGFCHWAERNGGETDEAD